MRNLRACRQQRPAAEERWRRRQNEIDASTATARDSRSAAADELAAKLMTRLAKLALEEDIVTAGAAAKRLNEQGFMNLDGRPWTRQGIRRYQKRIKERGIAPAGGLGAFVTDDGIAT